MARPKRILKPAVLLYDGTRWIRPDAPGEPRPGTPDTPPPDWLANLAVSRRSVRYLISGDLRRMDAALPAGLRRSERQALMAQEAADLSGADPASLLCMGTALGGGRGSATLVGVFARETVLALAERTVAAGLRFGGVASLELACLAAWRLGRPGGKALILLSQSQTLAVPPEPELPVVLSGGLRHAAADAAGWLARFTRAARVITPASPVRMIALGNDAEALALAEGLTLRAGYESVLTTPCEPLLAEAVRLTAEARPNRAGSCVPLENPCEPRKRFSHAWIAVPCVILLAAPFLCGWAAEARLRADTGRYRADAAQYLPLEKAVRSARAREEAARKALAEEESLQRFLAGRRRPLAAYVHAAYFFCRHAGPTMLLESLEDTGGRVTAKGTFADSEEGVRLEAALLDFAAKEGLRVAETSVTKAADAEGMPQLRFVYTLDYTRLGEQP